MIYTKQTVIKEVKETWSGFDRDGKASALYHVIDQDNHHYSTKEGAYYSAQIGQPVVLKWTQENAKKLNPNTNKPYINKNLIGTEKPEGQPIAPQPISPAMKRLKEVEDLVIRLKERMDNAGL